MSTFNYARAELRKLNGSDDYRIKITSGSGGETRWLTINRKTLDMISTILIHAEASVQPWDRERVARGGRLDATLREIAGKTPFTFDPDRENAPFGSELWHGFMGDVLAASHNLRVITMDRRNELMQELYVVWTGDTSSDSTE